MVAPGADRILSGVNFCGYLQTQDGLGFVARGLIRALRAAGIPLALHDLSVMNPNQASEQVERSYFIEGSHNLNVICANADQHFEIKERLGSEYFTDRYTIGVWFWELPQFPLEWQDRFADYSEVWVATSFVADALAPVSPIPVVRMPPPFVVEAAGSRARGRRRLNIVGDETVFLFTFNFRSQFERKNPLATIAAFRSAFAPTDPVRLVIKCVNSEVDPERYAAMTALAEGHRVSIYSGYWTEEEMRDLSAACDVYVSLHRAEGLGLTILDAMSLGKPVIATDWSGNTDFMNAENSFAISYQLVEIPKDVGPYKAGGRWAEPSITHAAELMRLVHDNREEAQARGRKAAQDIAAAFSVNAAASLIQQRLMAIRRQLKVESMQGNRPTDIAAAAPQDEVSELGEHFDNGIPTNAILHALYAGLDPAARARFGDPRRTAGPDSFFAWATARPRDGGLSRFLAAVYARRPDVAAVYPDPGGLDRPAFLQWARQHGAAELDFDPRLVQEDAFADIMYEFIREVVDTILPQDAHVLVAAGRYDGLLLLGGRVTRRFPQLGADEQAERPRANGRVLIDHLAALRAGGADYLLVPVTSYQELFEIEEFRRYLDDAHVLLWESKQCTVYQLAATGDRLPFRSLPIINEKLFVHSRSVRHLRVQAKRTVEIEARISEIETHFRKFEELASYLMGPGGRIEELAAEVRELKAEMATLGLRLNVRPYMAIDAFGAFGDLDRPLGYSTDDASPVAGLRFSDVFRGSEELVASRQRPYLALLEGMHSVVDIGCGRGEFLRLLRESGIQAVGVEPDPSLAASCRAAGLDVVEADAIGFLRGQPPASLEAIFSAGIIEHFTPEQRIELLALARDRLRDSGLFIAEAINPESFETFKAFSVDPTRKALVFPQVLLFECREAGFRSARIFYPTAGGFTQRHYHTAGEYAVVAVA